MLEQTSVSFDFNQKPGFTLTDYKIGITFVLNHKIAGTYYRSKNGEKTICVWETQSTEVYIKSYRTGTLIITGRNGSNEGVYPNTPETLKHAAELATCPPEGQIPTLMLASDTTQERSYTTTQPL